MFQTIIPLSEAATVKVGPGIIYEGQATGQVTEDKKKDYFFFVRNPKRGKRKKQSY